MKNYCLIDPDGLKTEIVNEIAKILPIEKKEKSDWLRSADVRKMLRISDSTLQTLRVKEIIPAYRLGDSWFYKEEEILAALEAGKNLKGGQK